MTKLEEKLIELGYKQSPTGIGIYYKDYFYCTVGIELNKDIIIDNYVEPTFCWTLVDIEAPLKEMDKVFNVMMKDLEELKKYE